MARRPARKRSLLAQAVSVPVAMVVIFGGGAVGAIMILALWQVLGWTFVPMW